MAASSHPIWQEVTVAEVGDAADGVRRVTFAYPTNHKASPGSHIDVRLSNGSGYLERSYSLVDSTVEDEFLTISVLLSPTSRGGSAAVHELKVGDRIEATQPLQNFPLSVGAARYVLVAGGIGITAVHAMAHALKARAADYELVYVGRNRSIMAYLDELVETHGDRVKIHVDDEGTPLAVDRLLESVVEHPAANNTEMYLCGPIRLMDHVRRGWNERGLLGTNLRFETFGNSGSWAPQEFIVRIPELDTDITVDANETMLEAMERSGVDVMFDCRKGECGLCQVPVLRVDGQVDHRDVFFSAREKSVSHAICACVSRVVSSGTAALSESDSSAQPEMIPAHRAILTIELT